MHRNITMQEKERTPYVIHARGSYSTRKGQEFAEVKCDIYESNETGDFGIWDNTQNKCISRAQYDPAKHLLRVALFHDQDRGFEHLIAGNAPITIIQKGDMKAGSMRPGKNYFINVNEDGEPRYGVWAFYFEMTAKEVQDAFAKKEGRVKVTFELEDADWDDRTYVPTTVQTWANKKKLRKVA
jgi:hypothetical protein|tara:strand:+ start:257 stop:805 length:549 start_codon:yes stop_codon:yes gene_type:complete